MTRFSIINLTRDSFIVEFEGQEYNVNGERGGDGIWDVYPNMVYRRGPAGEWKLIDQDSLKRRIVAALETHCEQTDFEWRLRILPD